MIDGERIGDLRGAGAPGRRARRGARRARRRADRRTGRQLASRTSSAGSRSRAGRVLVDLNIRLAPDELAFMAEDAGIEALIVDDERLDLARRLCARVIRAGDECEALASASRRRSPERRRRPRSPPSSTRAARPAGRRARCSPRQPAREREARPHRQRLPRTTTATCTPPDVPPRRHGVNCSRARGSARATSCSRVRARSWSSRDRARARHPRAARADDARSSSTTRGRERDLSSAAAHPVRRLADLARARSATCSSVPAASGAGLRDDRGRADRHPPHAEDHARGERARARRARRSSASQVEVRDRRRRRCAPGEPGEIWVRGPNMMLGYWNRPEETAAALASTAGTAPATSPTPTSDGYLYIVDRAQGHDHHRRRERVLDRGRERALRPPRGARGGGVRRPRRALGRGVHAVVVLRPGAAGDADELIEHCRARIAGYKLPRSIEFHAEPLPKSGAGKILKRTLREPHWEGAGRRVGSAGCPRCSRSATSACCRPSSSTSSSWPASGGSSTSATARSRAARGCPRPARRDARRPPDRLRAPQGARHAARHPLALQGGAQRRGPRSVPRARRGDRRRGARRAGARAGRRSPTALMCLEADPAACHRRVIAEALRRRRPGSGRRGPLDGERADEVIELRGELGQLVAGGGDLLRRGAGLLRGRGDLLGRGRSRRWRRRRPRRWRRRRGRCSRDVLDRAGQAVERGARLGHGLRGGLGELADLVGDDGEAAALLTGAGGLDRGVEREEVGLVGDRGDLPGQRDALLGDVARLRGAARRRPGRPRAWSRPA